MAADLKPVLPFVPREAGLRHHVFRVAALAARTAGIDGSTEEQVETVEWAALLHHYPDVDAEPHDTSAASRLLADLGIQVPGAFGPLPDRAAEVIRALRRREGGRTKFVRQACSLIEAANLFDEQMENMPYEERDTEAVIYELLGSGMICPPFSDALYSFRIVSRLELADSAGRIPTLQKEAWQSGATTAFASLGGERLWAHLRETAENARAVAKECGEQQLDDAFLAGLVHDVGRLVFDRSPARADLAEWVDRGFPATYAEFLISGTDHAAVGAEMLERWSFPEAIVEAVKHHHRPELTSSRLAALVYAAEDLDESLPSCARDHAVATRLEIAEIRRVTDRG